MGQRGYLGVCALPSDAEDEDYSDWRREVGHDLVGVDIEATLGFGAWGSGFTVEGEGSRVRGPGYWDPLLREYSGITGILYSVSRTYRWNSFKDSRGIRVSERLWAKCVDSRMRVRETWRDLL